MPDTKSSQTAFPQQGAQKAGLGFPICRLLAAVGLFKGKGSDEQSLLRQVLDTFQTASIVVGDAFLVPTFYWLKCSKEAFVAARITTVFCLCSKPTNIKDPTTQIKPIASGICLGENVFIKNL
jgi:hypothetical protein